MERKIDTRFRPAVADLGSEQDVRRAFQKIYSDRGPVRTLVNNAGIVTADKFLDTPLADLRQAMAHNFECAHLMSQHLVPDRAGADHQHVILRWSFQRSACCYGLFALQGRYDWADIFVGARVRAERHFDQRSCASLRPFGHDAKRFQVADDECNLLASISLRRLCNPDEVASAITYLAIDLAGVINGALQRD